MILLEISAVNRRMLCRGPGLAIRLLASGEPDASPGPSSSGSAPSSAAGQAVGNEFSGSQHMAQRLAALQVKACVTPLQR